MANDYSFLNCSHQWVYSYAMSDNWKKLQSDDPADKKIKHLKKVINDPDGYNTNLASKERVESLEEKMTQLHNKIDSIYTLLETLSNRFDSLNYDGEVSYGDLFHVGRSKKHISVRLFREEDRDAPQKKSILNQVRDLNRDSESPNPHGDDDYATPEDTDLFQGP